MKFTYKCFTFDLPEWVREEKNINDYIEKLMTDKEFATMFLLSTLQKEKDSYCCCELHKFFDSWVYGMNVMD